MNILILGAAGMIGRKLGARLLGQGHLGGAEIVSVTLADVIIPEAPLGDSAVSALAADLTEPGTAERLVAARPDVIFHLAGVVSGEAEQNFEKGYAVNMDGTRALFEAIRREGQREAYTPRVVLTSSVAVFGAPFPPQIGDEFLTAPLTSYGTQKAIAELLLADYSRRGFFDGIGLRLPTICIRPGLPNLAASGFFSNILREPLAGKEAVLPVPDDVRHWFASPRRAVDFLMHAAVLDLARVGPRRNLNMPGLSATVAEELAALARHAGPAALKLVRREPDPAIARIVAGWAQDFDATRALALGFEGEHSFDEIIRMHVEDEH
jgi:nucleoside-diphosphate-sugar epimerase